MLVRSVTLTLQFLTRSVRLGERTGVHAFCSDFLGHAFPRLFVVHVLQAAVWHALNHYAYRDAVFLAERLYAEGKAVNLFPPRSHLTDVRDPTCSRIRYQGGEKSLDQKLLEPVVIAVKVV